VRHPDEEVHSHGFPPIAREDARVLVLGSLPSEASLRAGEYYAHPRNAFERCQALVDAGIAVWDVLASSVRPGSLDSDIRMSSVIPNDFATFLAEHDRLQLVCFNGRKAEAIFHRHVMRSIPDGTLVFASLPSTSPAHASLSFVGKLSKWRGIIEPHIGRGEQT
jgi:hypoxanthine-DNA glycosylase